MPIICLMLNRVPVATAIMMDVDATIADVMRQADEYRKKIGEKKRSSKSSKKIMKNMHDTAKNAISNVI